MVTAIPRTFILSLLFLTVLTTSKALVYASEDIPPFTIVEKKTIDRFVDPLIIEGRHFPSMEKFPISGLRLYSHLDGKFVPIPFQVDEITEDGFKVLPEGPGANPDKADLLFDTQDELLFMAFDAGDRLGFLEPPFHSKSILEIEVKDPLNERKGWSYLLFFDSDPPKPSPTIYSGIVTPENPTGYEVNTEYFSIKGKQVKHGGELYNQIFYKDIATPPFGGGTGADYVDRMKWRFRVGLLFNLFNISFDEDSLLGNFLCWRKGPIRGTYRVWAVANLPLGLKSPRIVADIIGYDTSISTSTVLNIPINPGYVITEMVNRIGTDLSPESYGMLFFNSENHEGLLIDGVMSEEERNISMKKDSWRIISGSQGTLMNRSTWSENFLEQAESVEVHYTDDPGVQDSPDFHEGQIGHAQSVARVESMKPDKYVIFIEWYWPPYLFDRENSANLNLELVQHYLNFQDNPLTFSIGEEQGINKARPVPAKKWE